MKIRVLHVVSGANGGVERYLQSLLRAMNREKYENTVICSDDFRDDSFSGLAVRTDKMDMRQSASPLGSLRVIVRIRKILKANPADIVYLHSSKAGFTGRIAVLGLKTGIVYNPHGWAFQMRVAKWKSRLYAGIEKILAHFTHRIIVISEREKALALERNICPPEKIKVVLNGIETGDDGADAGVSRKALGIGEEAYVIGSAARIVTQKGFDVFVEAAGLIQAKLPQAFFLWVGDGAEREKMELQIARAGLSGCFYITGWVENPRAYISLFDQALLLSRWEGFGLVLAEYMLLKKPVIATDADAIPEVVTNNKTGIIVPIDDAARVAEVILSLFHNKDTAELLAGNGYEEALTRFSIGRVASETQRVLEEMLA